MEVNRGTYCLLMWCCLGISPLLAEEPQWIWQPDAATQAEPTGNCFTRVTFELQKPESGFIEITADNKYAFWLNGQRLGAGDNWQRLDRYDVLSRLKTGRNVLAVMAENGGGPAGLVARVVVKEAGDKVVEASSGKTWKTHPRGGLDKTGRYWWAPEFDDSNWKPAHVFGPLGKTGPWGSTPQVAEAALSKVITFQRKERPAGPFQLLDGDRVVFLGDTLIERAQTYDYLETRLTSRYPDRHITFRNLGWSADTVFGDSRAGFGSVAEGFEQLKQRVYEQQPTVIILGYGGAASAAGKQGLEHFREGLGHLLATLDETQAEIVFLSPLQQEDLGPPLPRAAQFNQNRQLYAQVLQEVAASRHAPFVNLYQLLGVGTDDQPQKPYTDNGVHLTAYGYWRGAAALEQGLGWTPQHRDLKLDAGSQGISAASPGTKVTDIKSQAGKLSFTVLDAALPYPVSPIGTGKLPVEQAARRTLIVSGLPAGTYRLSVDGQTVAEGNANQWAAGVTLVKGPEFDQVETLRNTILEKNQLFFHRWRPQNETYLFGFRKHEQGNNAKEIPMFDPLILEAEKGISKLRQPQPRKYVLERVP